jgi:hypothetical protein
MTITRSISAWRLTMGSGSCSQKMMRVLAGYENGRLRQKSYMRRALSKNKKGGDPLI